MCIFELKGTLHPKKTVEKSLRYSYLQQNAVQSNCYDGPHHILHAFWFCLSQICVSNNTQLLSGHEKNIFGVLKNIKK